MQQLENVIDFASYYRMSEHEQKVLPASAYVDSVIERLHGTQMVSPVLPFAKIGDRLQFRPSEVTVWAGYTGHGKSMMTSQAATFLMEQGQKVCIASLEMHPSTTLVRMVRQAWGTGKPSKAAVNDYMEFTDGKGWLYNQQGMTKAETILGAIRYSVDKLGIQHFFIDNLMKCVRGEDDYNGQKEFVDAATTLARDTGVHIHIVHHLRKGETDEKMPARAEVKGASSIVDQVDNLLLVWRNKKKERKQEEVTDDTPDSFLICDKQRNGEWEGRVGLWYNVEAQAYCESSQRRVTSQLLRNMFKRD
jgi:twinkle protein